MQIRCPVCDYTRDVDLEKIPQRAEFATCPKCRHRFRFRALDLDSVEEAEKAAPKPEHADVWEAVDSLRDQWEQARDEQQDEQKDRDGREKNPLNSGRQVWENNNRDESIPWEKPREAGYLRSFIRTSQWALLQPSTFFAALTRVPTLLPALLYYLAFGVIQGILNLVWLHLLIGMMDEHTLESLQNETLLAIVNSNLDISTLLSTLVFLPFQLTLQLLITAGFIHLVIKFTEPRAASFSLAFKVTAYASAAVALLLVPVLGIVLSSFGYMALLLIGCRHGFRLSWNKALIAIMPVYLPIIVWLFFLLGQ